MIYYVLEHTPSSQHAGIYDEFVDFEDMPLELVKALLDTQGSPYGDERKILASMPEITWHLTESRTEIWTRYLSLDHFFAWSDPAPGESGPTLQFDDPVVERFQSIPRAVAERLLKAKEAAELDIPTAQAFRDNLHHCSGGHDEAAPEGKGAA